MLQKVSILNKLFFWIFYSLKNPEKLPVNVTLCSKKKKKKHEFSTLIIIRKVSYAADQYIRMISEGSWHWRQSNKFFITGVNLYFKMYSNRKGLF